LVRSRVSVKEECECSLRALTIYSNSIRCPLNAVVFKRAAFKNAFRYRLNLSLCLRS
jgi:hypothetical protein